MCQPSGIMVFVAAEAFALNLVMYSDVRRAPSLLQERSGRWIVVNGTVQCVPSRPTPPHGAGRTLVRRLRSETAEVIHACDFRRRGGFAERVLTTSCHFG